MLVWEITLLIIFLLMSGISSGSEVALVSLTDIEIRDLIKRKKKGSKALEKLTRNPDRMIITILIINNIAIIAASGLATVVATDIFGASGAGIAVGVMTLLVLIFGEITPKTYAAAHSEGIALFMAPIILMIERIFFPIITIFEWNTGFALKIFGVKKRKKVLMTEERLKTAIEIGAEEKAIEHEEKHLLKKVLEFNDIAAKEVMTVRASMFCLDANMKVKDAVPIMVESTFSRVPLFLGSLDKIVGIVHIKEILEAIHEKEQNLPLRDIAIKPFFVNEETMIDDLFKLFQERHSHMAIVVGQRGKTVGLVTIEDLLEEIVGEIIDESDVTPNTIMRIDKKTILVDGETSPKYINSFFNTNLPEEDETINDYLLRMHPNNNHRGAEIKIKNHTYLIEEVGDNHIERVLIRKKS